jgi:hypothetical protein
MLCKKVYVIYALLEGKMNYLPSRYQHWIRQSDRVYQLTRMARSNEERDLVIATGCKSSIQKLVAALAEQRGPECYRVSCFEHPVLPGLEMALRGAGIKGPRRKKH